MTNEEVEAQRLALQNALKKVGESIGKVTIGKKSQFPYGWRKAAKGRTVWRILEEAVSQNLEKNKEKFGFQSVTPADSEVGIYDFKGKIEATEDEFYVNIKSAVAGKKASKDDISKADKISTFLKDNPSANLYIATFIIDFDDDDMGVIIKDAVVAPISWIPDVYVNPSNNGNLQSSKCKELDSLIKRTNSDFVKILDKEIQNSHAKKTRKVNVKKKT